MAAAETAETNEAAETTKATDAETACLRPGETGSG